MPVPGVLRSTNNSCFAKQVLGEHISGLQGEDQSRIAPRAESRSVLKHSKKDVRGLNNEMARQMGKRSIGNLNVAGGAVSP